LNLIKPETNKPHRISQDAPESPPASRNQNPVVFTGNVAKGAGKG